MLEYVVPLGASAFCTWSSLHASFHGSVSLHFICRKELKGIVRHYDLALFTCRCLESESLKLMSGHYKVYFFPLYVRTVWQGNGNLLCRVN